MKYSQFNSVVQFKKQYALYNSFHRKVILLVPELKDLLEASIDKGIDYLKECHPTFYQYLAKHEFIVDSCVDELEQVKALSKSIDENEKEFILFINPTMDCNFKCWYCYETHIKHSKLSTIVIEGIKKFIENKIKNNSTLETFSLSFFGGEPLLFFKKNVIPIIDYFIEQCKNERIQTNINFTSNGFLINRDFIDYFKKNNISPYLQITLDGYKEEHDTVRNINGKRGSYLRVVENIKLLIENCFFVRVRINYTDKNINNANKIINDFLHIPQELKDSYLVFDFHRVWQNENTASIDEVFNNTIRNFRKKGFKVDSKLSLNNVIDPCYADKRNSIVINYNGDIYECTARDFTKENREGYIDEKGCLIFENNFLEKRMNAKFNNKLCFSCKILPLCKGGCSQQALEHNGEDYCIYVEDEKNKIVKAKIDELLNNNVKNIKINPLLRNTNFLMNEK